MTRAYVKSYDPTLPLALREIAQILLDKINKNPNGIQDEQLARETGWSPITIHSNIVTLLHYNLITVDQHEHYHPTYNQYPPIPPKPSRGCCVSTSAQDDEDDE